VTERLSVLAPDHVDISEWSLWRYERALATSKRLTLGEGMTPLVRSRLGGVQVWLKLDFVSPTGSFKDRGTAVLLSHLAEAGVTEIIVESSGNAAGSMAAYAALAGIDCTVFAPASASPAKLQQARAFGARVVAVPGPRGAASDAAEAAAADGRAFYANHNTHPMFVEGVKTWAYEVWEQLGFRNPAVVFVPTGGGSAYVGAHVGFAEVGGEQPRLVAAQPAGCAPLVASPVGAVELAEIEPRATLAEGAAIAQPPRGPLMLQARDSSDGWAASISDLAMMRALKELYSVGVYAEPTAALGVAAFLEAVEQGRSFADGDVVILVTGSGLKKPPATEANRR